MENIESLRNRYEIISYFRKQGIEISQTEIDNLKKQYENLKINENYLTMQQLDQVAGGHIFLIKDTTGIHAVSTHEGDGFEKGKYIGYPIDWIKKTLKISEKDFYTLYQEGIPCFYESDFTLKTGIPNFRIIPYHDLTLEEMEAFCSHSDNLVNPIFLSIIKSENYQKQYIERLKEHALTHFCQDMQQKQIPAIFNRRLRNKSF